MHAVRELVITAGAFKMVAKLETQKAPLTCAAFLQLLPFRANLLHVRWSGEATWIPLGDLQIKVPVESAVSRPTPGEILLYPGGISETEILIPYGLTQFACRSGPLAGNHFMTVT